MTYSEYLRDRLRKSASMKRKYQNQYHRFNNFTGNKNHSVKSSTTTSNIDDNMEDEVDDPWIENANLIAENYREPNIKVENIETEDYELDESPSGNEDEAEDNCDHVSSMADPLNEDDNLNLTADRQMTYKRTAEESAHPSM